MNVAIYLPSPATEKELKRFIVETSFLVIQRQSEHRFIIITEEISAKQIPPFPNIETLIIKPVSNNAVLRRVWFDIKLPAILKKVRADLFLSFQDGCSSFISVLQCMFVQDPEKVKKTYLRKAQLILTPTHLVKEKLIEKYGIPGENITVIYASANNMFQPISAPEKEFIKNKYSDNKEFFLSHSFFLRQNDLISLLKSFSNFKKRQQSEFKLMLSTPINSLFEKSLSNYKYRSDVKFIDPNDQKELALITASAYAVVLPFNTNNDIQTALNVMRSAVPVIVVKDSVVSEVAKDAVLYAATNTERDIGEKMIQVYTDENYRSKLIERGKLIAETYTNEKAAEILWQSILKLLK